MNKKDRAKAITLVRQRRNHYYQQWERVKKQALNHEN